MKKSIRFLAAALLLVSCAVFAACKKPKITPHTHTYATEWKYDETQHWKECTGADCAEKSGAADHGFTYTKNATQHTATCSTCGYSAGAVNHTFGAATTGAKPWLVNYAACVCGQTKAAEADYTRMNNEEGLARLFTELTDNEGNLVIAMERIYNGDETWDARYEVNGKISCAIDKYKIEGAWVSDDYYREIINTENDIGIEYCCLYWLTGSDVYMVGAMNLCLNWNNWLWYDKSPEYVTAADFALENGKYTATADIVDYEITFNKDNIKLTRAFEIIHDGVYNDTYIITLGNSTKATVPQDVIDATAEHPLFMFDAIPNDFSDNYCNNGNTWAWFWEGDKFDEVCAAISGVGGYSVYSNWTYNSVEQIQEGERTMGWTEVSYGTSSSNGLFVVVHYYSTNYDDTDHMGYVHYRKAFTITTSMIQSAYPEHLARLNPLLASVGGGTNTFDFHMPSWTFLCNEADGEATMDAFKTKLEALGYVVGPKVYATECWYGYADVGVYVNFNGFTGEGWIEFNDGGDGESGSYGYNFYRAGLIIIK